MIRLHYLSPDIDQNSVACNFPLKINRKRLLSFGVDARLFISPKHFLDPPGEFFNCEVACIDNRVFRYTRRQKKTDEMFVFLEETQKRVNALLWFDTTDGTGSPQFDVLPYVTAYYKSSVLIDKSHYISAVYSKPSYLLYYNNDYGIEDEGCKPQTGRPSEEDLSRIHVSWNSALGVYGFKPRVKRYFLKHIQPTWLFLIDHKRPGKSRPLDVTCRLGMTHKYRSLRFHRKSIADIVAKRFNVSTSPVKSLQYISELRKAKIGVSPFGGGEICYRDYEIFINGSALLKPDMSFLDTWPQLYIDGISYIAHRLDFSDVEEKLDYLLTGDNWRSIAEQGQNLYQHYLVRPEGREEFCRHVLKIAQRHI